MTDTVQLHPAWRQGYAMIEAQGWTYGDLIPTDWLYEALGIEIPIPSMPKVRADRIELDFLKARSRLEAELLERRMMAIRKVKGGFEIVQPNEQTEWAEEVAATIVAKSLSRLAMRLTHVNASLLSAPERRANTDAINRAGALRAMLIDTYGPQRVLGRRLLPEFEGDSPEAEAGGAEDESGAA